MRLQWLLLAGLVSGCLGYRGQIDGNDGGTGEGAAGGRDGSRPLSHFTKIDLLFDINNSPSFGDKQVLLAAAVPDLVTRLVQPNCLNGTSIAGPSSNGSCAAYPGSTIEFPPVHDLHVGIISTSLGSRGVTGGGEVCDPTQMTNAGMPFLDGMPAISSHADDQAHLLNRETGAPLSTPPTESELETETTNPDVGGQSFLDWFPTGAAWAVNTGKSATVGPQVLSPLATRLGSAERFETDFAAMVVGVHFYGCRAFGSPIESWYRFLVQPDPYGSIVIDSQGLAQWSAVDATIIQQRHDFLRPESLVVIIDLTDKNDEEIDVRALGGQAYKFLDQTFQPPRGTSVCETDPASPSCTSCGYCQGGKPAAICDDPSCKMGPYTANNDPGFYVQVRTVHMKQKYGIDPQFPIGRYVLGLTSPKVPDRDHEYPAGANCYQGGIGAPDCPSTPPKTINEADLNCTNPLFAATLPDGSDLSATALCNASGAGGRRTPDLVFYAHIGGVSHQLLQSTPGDSTGLCPKGTNPADCPQKATLEPKDWTKILGMGWESPPSPPGVANPNAYNYQGIDSHMIEGFDPRPGIVELTTGPNPMGGGADPINGGDWITDTTSPSHVLPVSLEYACIFPLATPIDCSNAMDYATQEKCSCSTSGLPLDAIPSVCGLANPSMPYAMGTNDYTTQYYAKAYPSIREVQLVDLMGSQGILASICPIHLTDNASATDPLYGFRPALTAIVNRLKIAQ
jgi:hypothetical protein